MNRKIRWAARVTMLATAVLSIGTSLIGQSDPTSIRQEVYQDYPPKVDTYNGTGTRSAAGRATRS